jgi:hypothetical protein
MMAMKQITSMNESMGFPVALLLSIEGPPIAHVKERKVSLSAHPSII